MSRLGGNHLYEIAVLQVCSERGEPIVDAHPLAVIADLGMNAVSKIYSRRTLTQTHYIAIRSKHKHLLIK